MALSLLVFYSIGAVQVQGLHSERLPVSAYAACIMDADSGAVLFNRDMNTKRPPASTTKILTSLLLIENCGMSDTVTATKEAARCPESSIHLKVGEKLSVRQLLHAIMLRSANDACVAGAIHVSGSVAKFANLMNQRAKAIGCNNTHFVNPNGLPDPNHLTTAYDLALMGRHAMQYPLFRELAKTQKHELTRSINQKDRALTNRNVLLSEDPTYNGIKTGWTRASGYCFVGSVHRGGKNLISVVLNSEDWKMDTQLLMNWASANFESKPVVEAGITTAETTIEGAAKPLKASSTETISRLVGPETVISQAVVWNPGLALPIKQGDEVGELHLTDSHGWKKTVKLIATETVDKAPSASYSMAGYFALGLGAIGAYSAIRFRRHQMLEKLGVPPASSGFGQ